MAESTGQRYLSRIQEKEVIRAITTSDGRYIPHSGGLMGWHENAGVLKCELVQEYKFYTVIQAEEVRRKLFSRWQEGEQVSRRSSPRSGLKREVSVEFVWDGQTVQGRLRDYSSDGMRVAVQQPELDLTDQSRPTLRILTAPNSDTAEFEAPAQVMWINKSGRDRTVYTLGVMFTDMPPEDTARLKEFLK